MEKKIWEEFIQWGSGFNLEAEREYKEKGEPMFYHLTMYGLFFHNDEFVGRDISKLMEEVIKVGKKNMEILNKKRESKLLESK